MSRIGLKPISIPAGVTVSVNEGRFSARGPKGELSTPISPRTEVKIETDTVMVKRLSNDRLDKAAHGLINRLITNLITGVSQGYVKKLEMVGTGYRAKMLGPKISVSAGFSHPIEFTPLPGITLACEGDTVIVISGADKRDVGEVAAKIRAIRPPEPYQGKGIRYQGEIIRRKAGKATKTGSA